MRSPLILSMIMFVFGTSAIAAEPAAELASFSVFDKIDINELAKSDVKTQAGPPMGGRFLSVQSCYVVPGSPARQIEALRQWNPTQHRELKVFLHGDLPASPTTANFSKLRNAPDNSSVKSFVTATKDHSSDLQISKEEAKALPGGDVGGGTVPAAVVTFWSNLLVGRAKSFLSGGTAAAAPYNYGEETIRPNDEVNSLLKEQGKIRKQFSGLLGQTAIGRGGGSLAPELYWELLDVEDRGVVTLGASYNKAGDNGTHQSADVLYYASGGYFFSVTLYQMWPVSVAGKASTLVWRGDMISSASLASLHGVERLGSESAMMKEITKSVTLFRKDTAR
jgi:hypothetical protein